MLGAARASQYAGWWSNRPPSVVFEASGNLSYENYQTPVYSYKNDTENSGYRFKLLSNNTGYVNTASYTSNTDYNTYRWTHVMPFKLNLPAGISNGEGIVYTPRINNGDPGNANYSSWSWQRALTGNALNITFFDTVVSLPGDYTDWNDQWLFVVSCSAETSTAYTSWAGTGNSGNYYMRVAVFDETGTLIVKTDRRGSAPTGIVDITSWLTGAAGEIYTDDFENYTFNFNPFTSDVSNATLKHSNYWYSWGTMFDPLTTTNTSWRTTRPSSTIGTAVAWQNIQFTAYENPTTGTYYVTSSGDDLWVQPDDRQAELMIGGNSTEFSDRYSTTDFPKDIG